MESYYPLQFEFDSKKSVSNKRKHGIDFVEAQKLWEDRKSREIQIVAGKEIRWLVLGKIGVRLWLAVITWRGESIRIISVRRARREERKLYEN